MVRASNTIVLPVSVPKDSRSLRSSGAIESQGSAPAHLLAGALPLPSPSNTAWSGHRCRLQWRQVLDTRAILRHATLVEVQHVPADAACGIPIRAGREPRRTCIDRLSMASYARVDPNAGQEEHCYVCLTRVLAASEAVRSRGREPHSLAQTQDSASALGWLSPQARKPASFICVVQCIRVVPEGGLHGGFAVPSHIVRLLSRRTGRG
jgi:hypothetical protein